MTFLGRQGICDDSEPVKCAGSVEDLEEKRCGHIAVDLGSLVHGRRTRASTREACSRQLNSAGSEVAYYSELIESV